MSDLPPAPGSSTPKPPEKKRKKDRYTAVVLATCGVVLAGLLWSGQGEPTKTYPGRGEAVVEVDYNAAALILARAIAAEDQKMFEAAMAEAEKMTGCKPVTGARETTDPKDREQAARLRFYVLSLRRQGLMTGEADVDTPEGVVHQVIGFQC
jgi:hypothetical protein